MSRLEVGLDSGSLLDFYSVLWGHTYEDVLNILGTTGTILPIGDPKHGQPDATTFKTVGEEQVTFTWSEAPASFDTPLDLTSPDSFQGIIPVVSFNGTDEEADTPDIAYFSAVASAVSFGVWINIASSISKVLFAKYETSKREYRFELAGGKPQLELRDESANGYIIRTSADVITNNSWALVIFTYTGGTAAANIVQYINSTVASSYTDQGPAAFTAMENLSQPAKLGARNTSNADVFAGKMAGGPLGPFWVPAVLTPDQVLRLYEIGRRALAL